MDINNGQFKSNGDNNKYGIYILDRRVIRHTDVHYVCGTNLLFIFKNKENKGE